MVTPLTVSEAIHPALTSVFVAVILPDSTVMTVSLSTISSLTDTESRAKVSFLLRDATQSVFTASCPSASLSVCDVKVR